MKMSMNDAMIYWNKQIGSKTEASDYAGRNIHKFSHASINTGPNMWDVVKIDPNGKEEEGNLIVCHVDIIKDMENDSEYEYPKWRA